MRLIEQSQHFAKSCKPTTADACEDRVQARQEHCAVALARKLLKIISSMLMNDRPFVKDWTGRLPGGSSCWRKPSNLDERPAADVTVYRAIEAG
jgi:hypothetical protein